MGRTAGNDTRRRMRVHEDSALATYPSRSASSGRNRCARRLALVRAPAGTVALLADCGIAPTGTPVAPIVSAKRSAKPRRLVE